MKKKAYHHGDLKNALVAAGEELLSEAGAETLSLRKVAARAGVSHSAPYAHFADREALFAAISAVGFQNLHNRLSETYEAYKDDPAKGMVETAFTYLDFALERPARFKLMFSGIIKDIRQYPELVEISHRTFDLIEEEVVALQAHGLLPKGKSDLLALTVWSMVHGFISLYLEGQISRRILHQAELRAILVEILSKICLQPLPY